MRLSPTALAALLLLSAPAPAHAQQPPKREPERLMTEVKLDGFLVGSGVVNLVEGQVTGRTGAEPAQPLKPRLELENGHLVRVERGGRAEILLRPGVCLRLAGETEVAFADLSRERPKFKILRGAAILEVAEVSAGGLWFGSAVPSELLPGIYPPITVATPQGEFVAIKGGLYRFDVSGHGEVVLKVPKGEAVVARERVKGGMAASLRDGSATVASFDREAGDAFDGWSRERAALLVKSNKSLNKSPWSRHLRNNPRSYFRIHDLERASLSREQFTVSAVGGLVNFAEDAEVSVGSAQAWERLGAGVGLEYGGRVRTGADGRVEILLYPNCYLHLSSDTEVVYAVEGGGTTVEVPRGSVAVTSEFDDQNRAAVTLAAPTARYELVREGGYRLNVSGDGGSELIVFEGRARVAGSGVEAKGGRRVVARGAERVVSPVSREALDSFDVWSRKRAAAISAPNGSVRSLLSLFQRERTLYGGLWYFDAAAGVYTFVPGVWDFRSPYGGQYSTKFRGRR